MSLIKHELAHCLGAILALPGTESTITGGDDTWTTTHAWPTDNPGEWPVVASFTAGPLLVPEHASFEDRLFLSALPADLKARAVEFAERMVRPVLDALSDAELSKMAATVERDGSITIRRTVAH